MGEVLHAERVDAMMPVARDVLDYWADLHPTAAAVLGVTDEDAVDTLHELLARALAQVEAGTSGLQGAIERVLQRTTDCGRAR